MQCTLRFLKLSKRCAAYIMGRVSLYSIGYVDYKRGFRLPEVFHVIWGKLFVYIVKMNGTELSKWMPSILSVVIISGGGLITAGWMQAETANMRKEIEYIRKEISELSKNREEDSDLLSRIDERLKNIERHGGTK